MKALFKDPGLQAKFEQRGYAIVPLLQPAQVNRLLKTYQELVNVDHVEGLYESSRHNVLGVNTQINKAIYVELQQSADALFEQCDLYGGTYMVKAARNSEFLPLHQDWAVIEEHKFSTIFIWCPLVHVEKKNGGLFLVAGSHRFFDVLRSGTYPSNRYLLPPQLRSAITDISLDAGEAILYRDNLFHGSYANSSADARIVVTGRVVEKGAPLVYYHKSGTDKADVYSASPDFYLEQIDAIAKGHKPKDLKKLRVQNYTHHEILEESLHDKIRNNLPNLPGKSIIDCNLFRDAQLQEDFERDGFVVIDLFTTEKAAELLCFYKGLDNDQHPQYGFHVSLDNKDPEFVKKVSYKIRELAEPEVDRYFKDHQVFTSSFVVKENNPMGVVPPHQDWTFVDETRFWSATIWCPLVDVNIDNGALGVIKGSQHLYDHVRPSPAPQYKPPFHDQLFDIFPYLQLINLKAGQALVFNNKTIHGSPPNTTEQTRISFGIGVTHKDALIEHYYLRPDKQNCIEGFDVDSDFFYRYNNARLTKMHEDGNRPIDIQSHGLYRYAAKNYSTNELLEKFESAGNFRNDTLIQKMMALYPHYTKTDSKSTSVRLPLWKVYTPGNVYREIAYRLSKPRVENRSFWKVYTPRNIWKEIRYRISK